MITHEEYKKALYTIGQYIHESMDVYHQFGLRVEKFKKNNSTLHGKILDADLSARVVNILVYYFEQYLNTTIREATIYDLTKVEIHRLMNLRNFGRKSLRELQDLCDEYKINMLP